MDKLELILGIVILVLSVIISVLVLLQTGKDKKLTGTITGGADTFFSKQKSGTRDKLLARITPPLAIIFTLLVVFMYLIVA